MKRKASRKPASSQRTVVARRRSMRRVVLDSECLIETADALKNELLARVKRSSPVSIDASQVGRIDTANLQVLAAFARDCRAAGRDVEWVGVPSTLADTARLLNLSSMLGLQDAGEALPP